MAVSLLEASRTNPSLEMHFAKFGLSGLPHAAINQLAEEVVHLRTLGLLDEKQSESQPVAETAPLVTENIPYQQSQAGKPWAGHTVPSQTKSSIEVDKTLRGNEDMGSRSFSEFQRLMNGHTSEGREQRPSIVLTEKQIQTIATEAVNEFRNGASVEILQLHVIVRKRVREFIQEHGLVPKAHDATITAVIYYAQYLYY